MSDKENITSSGAQAAEVTEPAPSVPVVEAPKPEEPKGDLPAGCSAAY